METNDKPCEMLNKNEKMKMPFIYQFGNGIKEKSIMEYVWSRQTKNEWKNGKKNQAKLTLASPTFNFLSSSS